MKRLVVALLVVLAILPGAARADEPIGCALTSSALIAQPEGSVLIACVGGVTETFGGQLADIMTRILQNRLDPQIVMAKLDDVEGVADESLARTVSVAQRHAITQALVGKQAEQIAIIAHPTVDDSAEFAKSLAEPLLMVGWQIEGNQVRRAAPKALEGVAGVAIVVHSRDAAPPKAIELRMALLAGHIGAHLIDDPTLPADATTLWIGRRPVFMQPDAPKQ